MSALRCALLAAGLLAAGCVSEKRKGQASARADLGAAYLKEGNTPGAVATLEQATKLDRRNWSAWNRLGLAYAAAGASEKADAAFQKAMRLVPDEAEVLNNYGLFLVHQGRLDEAVATFEAARQDLDYRSPGHILTNLGYALHLQGQNDAALLRLDEAVRRAPNLCQARFNRALVQQARGQAELALADFESVIGLCGAEVPGAWYHAALLLGDAGQTSQACSYLELAVAKAPGSELARAAGTARAERCPR
jgi:type IV pilus biogenesis/stability protein PilW